MKLMKLLKETHENNPLNGMSKRQAQTYLQKKLDIQNVSKKIYHDEYWQPIQEWFKKLRMLDVDFAITKAEYRNEHGTPTAKTWTLEIFFTNERGKEDTLYGKIVAAGAGSIQDPLDKYDVVFTLA